MFLSAVGQTELACCQEIDDDPVFDRMVDGLSLRVVTSSSLVNLEAFEFEFLLNRLCFRGEA
jgi:hypothetical protein